MSEFFRVDVELPDDDLVGGKIRVSFERPSIYFAFSFPHPYSSDRFIISNEAQEYAENRAIASFLGLMEKDLRRAFKDERDLKKFLANKKPLPE